VLLLKSLFCLKGHDNGRRFLVISLIAYLLLILLLPILAQAGILLILLFLTASPILSLSAVRRIHDAHLATPLAAIPLIIYWLNLFGLTYLEHGSKWVLLVLAIVASLGFAALNNIRIRKNANYQFGYNGPLDLTSQPQEVSPLRRVEPTIEGQPLQGSHAQTPLDFEATPDSDHQELTAEITSARHNQHEHDWLQKVNLLLSSNQKLTYGVIGFLLLLIISALVIPLFSSEPDNQQVEEIQPVAEVKQRLNKIEMPDQFFVMLDQNDGLTIAWEGDIKSESELGENGLYWSPATAEGDKDCVSLEFTLGQKFRSVQVTVKNGGDYYADFSPVDTKVIVESIANKDRFKLCGYEFSLNGTRSLLRKNSKYREYLTQ
jgi:hypothetical protein